MQKSKKSNNELLYIRDLLFNKRQELVDKFLHKDDKLVGQSFMYNWNQAAFNLVRDSFFTLWIDSHITQLMNDEIPIEVRNKTLILLSELLQNGQVIISDSEITHTILTTKINDIKQLLKSENNIDEKLNIIKFTYARDKVLFEREIKKYETQATDFP